MEPWLHPNWPQEDVEDLWEHLRARACSIRLLGAGERLGWRRMEGHRAGAAPMLRQQHRPPRITWPPSNLANCMVWGGIRAEASAFAGGAQKSPYLGLCNPNGAHQGRRRCHLQLQNIGVGIDGPAGPRVDRGGHKLQKIQQSTEFSSVDVLGGRKYVCTSTE